MYLGMAESLHDRGIINDSFSQCKGGETGFIDRGNLVDFKHSHYDIHDFLRINLSRFNLMDGCNQHGSRPLENPNFASCRAEFQKSRISNIFFKGDLFTHLIRHVCEQVYEYLLTINGNTEITTESLTYHNIVYISEYLDKVLQLFFTPEMLDNAINRSCAIRFYSKSLKRLNLVGMPVSKSLLKTTNTDFKILPRLLDLTSSPELSHIPVSVLEDIYSKIWKSHRHTQPTTAQIGLEVAKHINWYRLKQGLALFYYEPTPLESEKWATRFSTYLSRQ